MGNDLYIFKKGGLFWSKTHRKSVRSEKKIVEWFKNKVFYQSQDIKCADISEKVKEVTNSRMLLYYTEKEDSTDGHPFFDILNFTPVG